jgi:hypothetical protein
MKELAVKIIPPLILACVGLTYTAAAQDSAPKVTLFTNVNVFDGVIYKNTIQQAD